MGAMAQADASGMQPSFSPKSLIFFSCSYQTALWPLLLTSGTVATAFWCFVYSTAPSLRCLRYSDAHTLHMKCQLRDGLSPEGEPSELTEDEKLDAITRINSINMRGFWQAPDCHTHLTSCSLPQSCLIWYPWMTLHKCNVSYCTFPFQRGCSSFPLLSLLSDTYPAIAKNQKIAICPRQIGKVPPLTKWYTSELLFHGANELLLIVAQAVLQQETSGCL